MIEITYTEIVIKEWTPAIERFINVEGGDKLILTCECKIEAVIVANLCRQLYLKAEVQQLDETFWAVEAK